MDNYLFINEVARLHSLTKKTLLYYDKIGLFKPVFVDEETGYRYYSHEQLPYLKQIIYLKHLGFTLVEIQDLLGNRNFPILIEQLILRKDNVSKEISELEQMQCDLGHLIKHYQEVQFIDERDLNKPGIKLCHDRYMIYQLCAKEQSVKEVMLAYRSLLRNLINMNIFSQMPYGTIALEPAQEGDNYTTEIGSFITLPGSMGLENEIKVPSGKYAYMYKKGGYYDLKSIDTLLKWVEDNGYTPVGNIYDHSLIDYTFTQSNDEMIQEIQIKIE